MRRLFNTKENREHWREIMLEKFERHEDKELGAVWGTKSVIRQHVGGGVMVFELVAFSGTSAKPDLHYVYRTPDARDVAVKNWLDGLRRAKAWKDERKAAKKATSEAPNPAKVGDILVSSWGYDQTNIDWYEVVEIIGKNTVVIREIAATSQETGWCRGNCSPVKGQYTGEAKKVRVNKGANGGYSVKVRSFAWAHYEGKGEAARRNWTSYA